MTELERLADREEQINAMRRQAIVGGHRAVAAALVDAGTLVTFPPGGELMAQFGTDRDAYFLLSGAVELRVYGKLLPYGRKAGQVVGEFAAINFEVHRTATVVATEPVVALKCSPVALRAAGKIEPELWELLAIDLTRKIEQRNSLVSRSNERPVIFMVATEEQFGVAEELRLSLARDYEVMLWSDEDIHPPGSFELERLALAAAGADFAIMLAHPDDLRRPRDCADLKACESIRFELGYLLSVVGRHRTVLLIPQGSGQGLPEEYKGMRPLTYPTLVASKPADVQLGPVVRQLRNLIVEKKVRSRIEPED